jgi:hypothetical protein
MVYEIKFKEYELLKDKGITFKSHGTQYIILDGVVIAVRSEHDNDAESEERKSV